MHSVTKSPPGACLHLSLILPYWLPCLNCAQRRQITPHGCFVPFFDVDLLASMPAWHMNSHELTRVHTFSEYWNVHPFKRTVVPAPCQFGWLTLLKSKTKMTHKQKSIFQHDIALLGLKETVRNCWLDVEDLALVSMLSARARECTARNGHFWRVALRDMFPRHPFEVNS